MLLKPTAKLLTTFSFGAASSRAASMRSVSSDTRPSQSSRARGARRNGGGSWSGQRSASQRRGCVQPRVGDAAGDEHLGAGHGKLSFGADCKSLRIAMSREQFLGGRPADHQQVRRDSDRGDVT